MECVSSRGRCVGACAPIMPWSPPTPTPRLSGAVADGEERPPAAPIHWLGPDDDWGDAPQLGMLAKVFNQDVYNMPRVQKGLRTMKQPHVIFADYGESKLRHFHALLEEWIQKP